MIVEIAAGAWVASFIGAHLAGGRVWPLPPAEPVWRVTTVAVLPAPAPQPEPESAPAPAAEHVSVPALGGAR